MVVSLEHVEINPQFAQALAVLEEGGDPLFITGRAGTGKSTLLNYFRAMTERSVVVLAPTGVAAVNVAGQTIHSFFGFKPDITQEKAEAAARKVVKIGKSHLYRSIETLVIDEISMVRADLLDCVDRFLRIARGKKKRVFGGVHLVMIGDLYQLPPVVSAREAEIFNTHYRSPFFFDARACANCGLRILELEKIYRQSDERFIQVLNAIRNNTAGPRELAILNARCDASAAREMTHAIHLTALNREADAINAERLSALSGKSRRYAAMLEGKFEEKSSPAEVDLELKKGAQVMLLNNDAQSRWVNGTIAEVVELRPETVVVRLPNDTEEEVEPFTWQMYRFELDADKRTIVSEPIGTFKQLPLALAWAITIHKSQGKTFDRAVIDLGRAFACGQAYVALSRVRSLEGIVLQKPLLSRHIRVDRRVVVFLTGHAYAVSEQQLPLIKKQQLIEAAIECGHGLKMTYLKNTDVKTERLIRPLELGEMEYAGKLFLGMRGVCCLRNEERVFRLDRILALELVIDAFEECRYGATSDSAP